MTPVFPPYPPGTDVTDPGRVQLCKRGRPPCNGITFVQSVQWQATQLLHGVGVCFSPSSLNRGQSTSSWIHGNFRFILFARSSICHGGQFLGMALIVITWARHFVAEVWSSRGVTYHGRWIRFASIIYRRWLFARNTSRSFKHPGWTFRAIGNFDECHVTFMAWYSRHWCGRGVINVFFLL